MKRELSDSETDDVFDDISDKTSPSPSGNSCQMVNRKKRRGIIEKKRRDRINNSLSELRRLVPTAFEKQGSAKLEKAEILQMTVDHLKILHAKGFDAFSFDPHKFASDYHGVGFRECASEVARYLVSVEGLDIQDPLRLRLISHLQCFSAQRDHPTTTPSRMSTNINTATSSSPPVHGQSMTWNSPSQFITTTGNGNNNTPPSLPPLPPPLPLHHHALQMSPPHSHSSSSAAIVDNLSGGYDQNRFHDTGFTHHHPMRLPSPPTHGPPGFSHHHHQSVHPNYHHLTTPSAQYPVHHGSFLQPLSPTTYAPSSSTSPNTQVKPYRPWGGAEMVY